MWKLFSFFFIRAISSAEDEHKFLLMGGGITQSTMEIYNPIQPIKNHKLKTRLIEKKSSFSAGVLWQNGEEIVVTTGGDFGQMANTTEIFIARLNKITLGPSRNSKLRYNGAGAVENNAFYLCGGLTIKETFSDCERFHDGKWNLVASMNRKRSEFVMVSSSRFLYAIGGEPLTETVSVERYSAIRDSWSMIDPVPSKAYGGFAVAAIDNYQYIFVCGGTSYPKLYRSCDRYNEKENKWTKISDMKRERSDFVMLSIGNKLYAMGGGIPCPHNPIYHDCNQIPTNSVKVYDATLNIWNETVSIIEQRYSFSGVVIQ